MLGMMSTKKSVGSTVRCAIAMLAFGLVLSCSVKQDFLLDSDVPAPSGMSNRETSGITRKQDLLIGIDSVFSGWVVDANASLDALKENPELDNIEIFPINVGKDSFKKSEKFFKDLNINNLNIYFDNPTTLARDFSLRGVPTTIFFNKESREFARVIGSIDFEDEEFIQWIKNYN